MNIELNDYQLIYVVVGLWIICCFRPFLNCFNVLCCDSSALASFCQQQIGCNEYDAGAFLRGIVLFLSFLQPVFLIIVQIVQHVYNESKLSSLQFNENVKLISCMQYHHNNHTTLEKIHYSNTIEFDFLILAFLSGLCQSLSCYAWVMCQKHNYISSTTTWNSDLDENMQFYELFYFLESFFTSLACLSLIGIWTSFAEFIFCNCCICVIIFYFLIYSKFERSSNSDILYSSLFMFFLILNIFFVISRLRNNCIWSSTAAFLYISCIAINVNVHYISDANFLASTILCVRILISIILNTYFLIVTAIGLDGICTSSDDVCLPKSNWPYLNNCSTAAAHHRF